MLFCLDFENAKIRLDFFPAPVVVVSSCGFLLAMSIVAPSNLSVPSRRYRRCNMLIGTLISMSICRSRPVPGCLHCRPQRKL